MIVTYWYCMNGAQQIIGGLLAYLFSLPVISRKSVITSWQAFFITLGCFSVVWGVFVLLWMPDSAMSARCFSEADKTLMIERVRNNQTGLQNRMWRKEHVKEAFTDPQTYAYCLIALTTTIPTSGLGSFANIIITENLHFDSLQTQLIAIPRGIAIIIILLSSTWFVNWTGQNLFVMAIYVIPSFIGTMMLIAFENTTPARKIGLLISFHVILTFWAAQGLAMSMISRNVAGQTKKSVVVAANFVCWAIGNAIGTWPSQNVPFINTYLTRSSTISVLERPDVPHRFCRPHGLLHSACSSYSCSSALFEEPKPYERCPCDLGFKRRRTEHYACI
jgi:predicted MFS family arabinose efflux permease